MGLRDVWNYLTTDPKKAPPGKRRIKLTYSVVLFILINSILGSSLFYLPSLGVISSGAASIIAWIALFIIASCVAYSRVYIGVHFPLDILSGALFGTLWAICYYWISSQVFDRFFSNTSLKI